MPESKQSVNLPVELVSRIQSAYIKKHGSARGAVQEILMRGAELALAELTGENNHNGTLAPSGNPQYNPSNVTQVKKKISQTVGQLDSLIRDLELFIAEPAEISKNVPSATVTNSDSTPPKIKRALRDAFEKGKRASAELDRHAGEFEKATAASKASKQSDAG